MTLLLRRVRRWRRQPVPRMLLFQQQLLPTLLPPPHPAVPLLSQPVQSRESSSVSLSPSAPLLPPSSAYADEGKQPPRIHKNFATRNQISLLPRIPKKRLSKSINPPIPPRLQTLMSPWRLHLELLLEPHEVHLKCLLSPSKLSGHTSVVNLDQSPLSRNRV